MAPAWQWQLRHKVHRLVDDPRSYFGVLYGSIAIMWLAFLVRWALHEPQGSACEGAPQWWINTGGANVSALPHDVEFSEGRLRFMSIWSTAGNFSDKHMRSVESVFFHHPKASFHLYSNELPHDVLAPLAQLGYDVNVRRYDLQALLGDTPAAPWLQDLERWQAGKYYYSHVTDVMRYALLFKEGGVYIDTDVIVVRPIVVSTAASPPPSPAARQHHDRPLIDSLGGPPEPAAPAPLAPHSVGAEAHAVGTNTPILNGAVMVFSRGSPFLWAALRDFGHTYRDYEWGWNGPELLTRVRKRCPAHVAVLSEARFYPFHWEEVDIFSGSDHAQQQNDMWHVISERSYTAHLWNKKSGEFSVSERSLYYRLLNEFRVLKDGAQGVQKPRVDGSTADSTASASREPVGATI